MTPDLNGDWPDVRRARHARRRWRTWGVALASAALVTSMGMPTAPGSARPAVAAVTAAAWTAPQALSSAGLWAKSPQVAAAANGDATVVWRQRTSTGTGVMASWRVDGGAWSAPKWLSRPATSASAPQVAVNGRSAVVVWRSAGRIMASRHPAGSGWTRPAALSGKTRWAENLDVAMDSRGDITVVWNHWSGNRGSREDAVYAVRRLEGRPWGDPVRVSGRLSRPLENFDPEVAMGGGQTTVLWLRPTNEDPCFVMEARRSRGAANWSAPAKLDSGEGCTGPLVAMNRRGDTAAAWDGAAYEMVDRFVVAGVRPAGGRWHAKAFFTPLSSDLGGVALDTAGNATVVWSDDYDEGSEEGDPGVLAARRPVGGPWESPTFLTGEGIRGSGPSVAAGGETTTAVYSAYEFPSSGYLPLQGVQRTSAGTWGEAQALPNDPSTSPREVRVAMDARDGTVVVWTQLDDTTPRVMVTTG